MRHCADIQARGGFAVKSITPGARAARPRHATAPARHVARPCARIERKPGPIGPCRAPIDPRPLARMGADWPRAHWTGKRSANRANMPPGVDPARAANPLKTGRKPCRMQWPRIGPQTAKPGQPGKSK